MARLPKAFRLWSFLLPTIIASAAQPARYHMHPRYLHLASGTRTRSEAAIETVDSVSRQDNTLLSEYRSKLALRHAAMSIFERTESTEVQRRGLDVRQDENIELQEKINELETSFHLLMALLAADCDVTFGVSSETSSSTIAIPSPTMSPIPGSIVATSTSTSATVTSTDSASSTTSSGGSSAYTFDPMSSSNVAVYYGQTDQTSSVSLTEVCSDPSVDIVILAFLNNFYTPYPIGLYPTLNLGPRCRAASSAQVSAGASGLIDCVSDGFAELVRTCQTTYGKKILLSLGGAVGYSDTRIPNDAAANTLADTIWDLFLGGSGLESIRPFGNVVLDGIDIDNEDPANNIHLPVLISSLRQNFNNATSTKPYFLSAAPQCPRPDQSIPLQSMRTHIDFVWPQFYNNPACDLDSNGFISSLQAWAGDLRDTQQDSFGGIPIGGFMNVGNGVAGPRLLVGSPAFGNAGSGFVEGGRFEDIVAQVKNMSLSGQFDEASPFGGFMFWDAAYGEESGSVDGFGKSYMEIVKDVLEGSWQVNSLV